MIETANFSELKDNTERLIKRVVAGEEILLTHDGTVIARLVPYSSGSHESEAPHKNNDVP